MHNDIAVEYATSDELLDVIRLLENVLLPAETWAAVDKILAQMQADLTGGAPGVPLSTLGDLETLTSKRILLAGSRKDDPDGGDAADKTGTPAPAKVRERGDDIKHRVTGQANTNSPAADRTRR